MLIENKSAVITGAARGGGRSTSLALAKLGCNVAINYRSSQEEANRTVSEISDLGVKAMALQGDVKDDEVCRRLMESVYDEFGSIDILVNNAGSTVFIPHDDLEKVEETHWNDIFATNVRAVFQCSRAARPFMVRSGGGEIVNIGSVAGLRGTGSSMPYSASKAAVHMLTVSLARVLGPEIRVNTVAPGLIAGDWLKRGLGAAYDKIMESAAKSATLGKVSQPDDIAEAVVSLITGSDMVTGQLLVCDGGAILAP